jgi:hypothetical protein
MTPKGLREPLADGLLYSEVRLLYLTSRFTCKTALFGEPTSGLEPLTCSLRVIIQVLQEFAGVCKSRISKPVSLLSFAGCCTVLRSRWDQNGIRTSNSYSLTVGPMARPRGLRSHNPLSLVSIGCPLLQKQLI